MSQQACFFGLPSLYEPIACVGAHCDANDVSTCYICTCILLSQSWRTWQGDGKEYIMQPRMDKLSCQTFPIGGSAGPTAQAQRRHLLQANAAHLGMVRCSQRPED